MNRPDEIAAMAACKTPLSDHVASFWKLLETETVHLSVNIRRVIGHDAPDGPTVYYDCTTFSDEVAKELVRLSATSPGDAVREAWQEARKYVSSHADAGGAADAIIAMEAALATAEKAGDQLAERVNERLSEGDGYWQPCSGCYQSNQGYPIGTYSNTFRCELGMGCSECGGIGAIWDNADYSEIGADLATPTPPSGDVEQEIESAQGTLDAYQDAMASQEKNMSDAKLIVMANYGDLCASHLKRLLKLIQSAAPGGGTEVDFINRRNAEYLGSSDGSVDGHASVQRGSDPSFISKADGSCDQRAGVESGPSDNTQEPQAVAWRDPSEIPSVKAGSYDQYIVAVRRAHNGKVYSFAGEYLNAYPLRYDDCCPKGDGCEGIGCEDGCPTTGWYQSTGDGYDGTTYNLLLGKGDELVGWCEVPKWEDRYTRPVSLDREALAQCMVRHDPNYCIYHMPGDEPRKYKSSSGAVRETRALDDAQAERVRVRADAILAKIEGRT